MGRSREQAREYMSDYRARKRAEAAGSQPQASSVQRGPITSATDYVLSELQSIPEQRKRPGDVAIALAMARILDDRSATPQQAQAAGRLAEALMRMREGGEESKGKLATLREIRGHRAAG